MRPTRPCKRTEQDIARLNETDQKLASKRRETERQAGMLKSRQADLASLIDKREAVYQQTETDRQAEEEHAAKKRSPSRRRTCATW